MRLISLNIWGGRAFEALAIFLREHASAADAFCFQEVFAETSASRAVPADRAAPGADAEALPVVRSDAARGGEAASAGDRVADGTAASTGLLLPGGGAPRCTPPPHTGSVAGSEPWEHTRRLSLSDLESMLPEFVGAFAPMERLPAADGVLEFGLATLVRRGHDIRAWGQVPILSHEEAFAGDGWQPVGARPLQYCRLILGGREVVVANFHGTPIPGTKLDTPERLAQSRRIRDVLLAEPGEVILAGDFNLLPSTESVALLERHWRNLVREYGIATTRSRLNEYYGTPEEQKHADYVFVSRDVAVHRFAVPDAAVSDHLPLIVDFTTSETDSG